MGRRSPVQRLPIIAECSHECTKYLFIKYTSSLSLKAKYEPLKLNGLIGDNIRVGYKVLNIRPHYLPVYQLIRDNI